MDPEHLQSNTLALQPPLATYLVLRVADIDTSAQFFALLGFNPIKEKHGDGPQHFSFSIHRDLVCELYPWNKNTSPPENFARLGILVTSLEAVRQRLLAANIPITREAPSESDRQWILVLDPDGNQIEIFEQPEVR